MYEHSDKYYLGIDIGGSHISSVLIESHTGNLIKNSFFNQPVTSNGDRQLILNEWKQGLQTTLSKVQTGCLAGLALAVPGPFDYANGICLMEHVNKYNALYGLDIKKELRELLGLSADLPVVFENDAACFGLGESLNDANKDFDNIIAITLGTGFGSAFIRNHTIVKEGKHVPANGELYNVPYLDGVCEDYISSKWILNTYNTSSTRMADSVYSIARRAKEDNDENATRVFEEFGKNLAASLQKWIIAFNADCVVLGGNIARGSALFLPAFKSYLQNTGLVITVKISEFMEISSIKGATALIGNGYMDNRENKSVRRKSSQPVLPQQTEKQNKKAGEYDIYPSYHIGSDSIGIGFDSLAEWIAGKRYVMIDGIAGNDWKSVKNHLAASFAGKNITVSWYDASQFQHDEKIIEDLVRPFVSEEGEVWGKRTSLRLPDLFQKEIQQFTPGGDSDLHVLIGTGAALANWPHLIYIDVPKNELQYRMRAGQRVSLINTTGLSNQEVYKRLYFVDWVLNKSHRQEISDRINVIADGQWQDTISWALADAVYAGLYKMTRSPIRARPWFEAGAWGGQWLKNHIHTLNPEEVNYAWSFELIVPENGIVLESGGNHLEIAFDWLMDLQAQNVLGKDFARFGTEFPIRFDYLDTVDGGNLSIQCHPSPDYIRKQFGENITQDETYYILDCKEDASVFLGFQESINPEEFRNALEESLNENKPVNITDFVQSHSAKKHDLFLIPNRTIHSAGKNNLVLEISATPYIFTFKMYDWLRLDLDGNPRPINIEHAFHNLDFSRKGKKVPEELISKPSVIARTDAYQLIHLPTHPDHFYDVHRIEFVSSVKLETGDQCYVMMLVEGKSVIVKSQSDEKGVRFNYAETFIIPASVESFEIFNETNEPVKIIKAFVK